LDKAVAETKDPPTRTKLMAALGHVHKADDEIVRALKLDRIK
jgi:hypothetical protein